MKQQHVLLDQFQMPSRIEFLALYREMVVVSSARVVSTARHEDVLKQIFSSSGWATVVADGKSKLEIKSGQHIYVIERYQTRALVCVCGEDFPTRLIYSGAPGAPRVMGAFRDAIDTALASLPAGANEGDTEKALKRALKTALPSIAERFKDPTSVDKVADAMKRVNELKVTLHETLLKATERDSLLEGIDTKSNKLAFSARSFAGDASSLRAGFCCRHYKCVACMTLFFTSILAIIILVGLNASGVVKLW